MIAESDLRINDIAPFLARYSLARTSLPEIPGAYCVDSQLWLVDTGHTKTPIIEFARDLSETLTKTMAVQELDDKFPDETMEFTPQDKTDQFNRDYFRFRASLLDLSTKTAAQLESDDTSPMLNGFL